MPMQDNGAFRRIDAALTRIEAHLDARRSATEADEELVQLRAAHQRLRGRVEEAVVSIDRMLEER